MTKVEPAYKGWTRCEGWTRCKGWTLCKGFVDLKALAAQPGAVLLFCVMQKQIFGDTHYIHCSGFVIVSLFAIFWSQEIDRCTEGLPAYTEGTAARKIFDATVKDIYGV